MEDLSKRILNLEQTLEQMQERLDSMQFHIDMLDQRITHVRRRQRPEHIDWNAVCDVISQMKFRQTVRLPVDKKHETTLRKNIATRLRARGVNIRVKILAKEDGLYAMYLRDLSNF